MSRPGLSLSDPRPTIVRDSSGQTMETAYRKYAIGFTVDQAAPSLVEHGIWVQNVEVFWAVLAPAWVTSMTVTLWRYVDVQEDDGTSQITTGGWWIERRHTLLPGGEVHLISHYSLADYLALRVTDIVGVVGDGIDIVYKAGSKGV